MNEQVYPWIALINTDVKLMINPNSTVSLTDDEIVNLLRLTQSDKANEGRFQDELLSLRKEIELCLIDGNKQEFNNLTRKYNYMMMEG
jgi:hypothetical protein